MPDDRFFHKKSGHSSKVTSLSDFEELTWRYYIQSADDFGVMRYWPISLQHDHDRMAAKSAKSIQRALDRVREVGLIDTFEHQGRTYCFQRNWQEYQKVQYPRCTNHPKPPTDSLELCDAATRELFALHPGGWGRKKPEANGSVSVPRTVTEPLPEHFENVLPKPLPEPKPKPECKPEPLAIVPSATDARSKRPIFKGQRFVVFEWMLDDLRKLLGSHFDDFDVHEWFFALDAKAVAANIVVPQRDGGKWLQEQTESEAIRRGLPVATSQRGTGKTAGNAFGIGRFIAKGAVQ